MITNQQSDFLYCADTLIEKHPVFAAALGDKLLDMGINHAVLPSTKDIWCRDYMPIQLDRKKFIQFQYPPSYLQNDKYKTSITDVDEVCRQLKIETIKSEIILDGGNIVCSEKKAIITDRVFSDNKEIPKVRLIDMLCKLLEVDEIIIIPNQPFDIFGHADGMLRFIDENTVLVNDFSEEREYFRKKLRKALDKYHLEQIPFTYTPSKEVNADKIPSAAGTYINYLHIGKMILMPTFGIPEDEKAYQQLSRIFASFTIETINAVEIANEGGVLNCIGWNVMYWKLILKDFDEYYLVMN